MISIITVVYNAENTLEQTILSVINQTYQNKEFIIIDGKSTDKTNSIIEKYQHNISYYISEKDDGIYDAMHKGIKQAKGNFVYFLGADDVFMDENTLTNVASYLKNNKFIYYGNAFFKAKNLKYDGYFNSFKIVTRNICHQSIFYPRDVFKKYTYNLNYKILADYDLNIRLFFSGYFKFKYMPLTVALFNDEGLSGAGGYDDAFVKDRLTIIKNNSPYYIYWYRLVRSLLATFKK